MKRTAEIANVGFVEEGEEEEERNLKPTKKAKKEDTTVKHSSPTNKGRASTFMLGTHPTAGQKSPIQFIDSNVGQIIFSFVVQLEKVVVVGGCKDDRTTNEVMVCSISNPSSWEPMPSMKNARQGFASALVGNRFFVFGGYGTNGPCAECEVLDLKTTIWSDLPPLPKPLEEAQAFVIDKETGTPKILVVGGLDSECTFPTTFHCFEVCSNSWSSFPQPSINEGRRGFGSAQIGENCFIVCGWGWKWASLDSTEWRDPKTGKWYTLESKCLARHNSSAVAIGSRIFLIGGLRFGDDRDKMEVLDISQGIPNAKWEVFPVKHPFGLYKHAAVGVGEGKIWTVGGRDRDEILELETESKTIKIIGRLPHKLWDHAAFAF